MDHMMPDMDGIEAVAKIREREGKQRKNTQVSPKGIPIIALTANAVSGMKEMFLEKGFSDYLSKPIEIAKLDELISRWIPDEKRIKTGLEGKRESFNGDAEISIPGIDAVKGINMTGGTLEGYKKVLSSFYKDALDRLPYLSGAPAENELSTFTNHVHALKSAAATIGAAELSKEAAELEAAGKAGTRSVITEKLPGFYEHLKETAAAIQAALVENTGDAKGGDPVLNISDAGVHSLFLELKTALEAKDMEAIDRITGELSGKKLDKGTLETLNAVSDLLLVGKFKQAVLMIEQQLRNRINRNVE
jgi:CheY-like chemotaxis protein